MLSRRGFLKGILAASAAPAIVRADSLMRWRRTESGVIVAAEVWYLGDPVFRWIDDNGTLWISKASAMTAPPNVHHMWVTTQEGGRVEMPVLAPARLGSLGTVLR